MSTTFFSHENHPFPPSLSDGGKLYLGKKADLLNILADNTQNDPPDSIDVKLLDGAAVVHFLSTASIVTFDEYADQVFVPHVLKQLENSKRVDIVWDRYIPAVSRNQHEKNEERVFGERLQVRTSCQQTGLTSYGIQPTNKNCLHSFPAGLPQ